MSFANLVLYGRVIPNLGKSNEGDTCGGDASNNDKALSADNPDDWAEIKKFYRHRRKQK